MSACEERSHDVLLYLDNELRGQELESFRAHLSGCGACRAQLEEEQEFSDLLYRSRPLYTAPDELRARVIATQHVAAYGQIPDRLHRRVLRLMKQQLWNNKIAVYPWRALAAIALVFVLGMIFVPPIVSNARAATYIDTALTTHRSYLDGNLPLEIESDSPEAVTAWFAGKVPFDFRLPASQSIPNDESAYRLVGARLVNYKGSYAALVTYVMKNEHISLLVASNKSATASGGEEIRSGALTFHYQTKAGFNVITWGTHGLTYAQVSSLHTSAHQSCLVCHQNMADSKDFREHQ
jgi:mycothiol system anti-sigma-R factor